jgi:folate-binding protein YgfZ
MAEPSRYAPLPSRALIAVSGPDWRSFLQGQLTQDVDTLAPGEARFGALLTPQGRLLFDLFIVGRDEGCWLDVAAERRDALIQRLKIYRLRAKAEIVADDTPVAALFPAVAAPGWVVDPRLPALGLRGYGVTAEALAATEADYHAHCLALGVPGAADWGEDKTYPIEADFDLLAGIDFKKGCFVGQETTSRMKRRGVIKTRMLPITFEGPAPAPGAEVLAGELRAGEVLSGVEGRAMALLRLDRIDGATLTVDGRPVRAEPPAWIPLAS